MIYNVSHYRTKDYIMYNRSLNLNAILPVLIECWELDFVCAVRTRIIPGVDVVSCQYVGQYVTKFI